MNGGVTLKTTTLTITPYLFVFVTRRGWCWPFVTSVDNYEIGREGWGEGAIIELEIIGHELLKNNTITNQFLPFLQCHPMAL